jgi:hypothetical protein
MFPPSGRREFLSQIDTISGLYCRAASVREPVFGQIKPARGFRQLGAYAFFAGF